MTSTSLPIRTDRFRLSYRRAGLVAAVSLQVLLSGCGEDKSSSTAKMAPTASTPAPGSTTVATSMPATAAVSKSEGPVVAKVNGIEIREGDIKLAEEKLRGLFGESQSRVDDDAVGRDASARRERDALA